MRGKLAAFKMPAQDFGPTWEDWVDAAFRIVIDTKGSVISRTDSEALALRKAEEAETQRRKRENKRLEEENLILRKAAAVFARGIA